MTSRPHLFGVDIGQWKALTLATLKMDMRNTGFGSGAAFNRQSRSGGSVVGLGIFYFFMGAFGAAVVVFVRDVLLSGTIVLSYLMMMVGTMILLDHHSVITSPDDYVVLGSRPVGSRTYFAVRLANVLAYTAAATTIFGVIPLVAFGAVGGWRMGLLAVPAFYLSAAFVALVLIAGYAGMLRAFGADRLNRALAYLQFAMSFGVYGAYFLMSSLVNRRTLERLTLPDSPLLWLYPPTWFAGYLSIGGGQLDATTAMRVLVSLACLAALGTALGGRLSLQYAERLGAATATTVAPKPRAARPPVWFRTGEARAISLLVRAQFRHDQRFRMAILGVLPLTLLWVFMSLRHGPLPDPFAMDWRRASDMMLITLAVFAFPSTLRMNLSRSDAYKASWIYFSSPTERRELVRAMKNVLVGFFLVPYLAFVAVILAGVAEQPWHVAVHVGLLGLISQIFLQLVILVDPSLPFSQPSQKTARSGAMFVTMTAALAFAMFAVPLLAAVVYPSGLRIAAAAALILALSVALDRLTRVRVERLARQMEFEG